MNDRPTEAYATQADPVLDEAAVEEEAAVAKDPPQLPAQRLGQLKARLNSVQLERSIAALRKLLPESEAKEAEITMRRMFARAKRWDA